MTRQSLRDEDADAQLYKSGLENQGVTENGNFGKNSNYQKGPLYKASQEDKSQLTRDPQANVLYNELTKPLLENNEKINCNW